MYSQIVLVSLMIFINSCRNHIIHNEGETPFLRVELLKNTLGYYFIHSKNSHFYIFYYLYI
jgi:hypothetical protein